MRKLSTNRPIGFQPYSAQVELCGRDDEAKVLSLVGGIRVGSHMADDFAPEIVELESRGLVAPRSYRYALTDAGFSRLAEIGWGLMHDQALEMHMSDDADVPDYVIGGGEKKRTRKPRPARARVRVIRPKTKSHKPAKRK